MMDRITPALFFQTGASFAIPGVELPRFIQGRVRHDEALIDSAIAHRS
jgi:hypothetical protein